MSCGLEIWDGVSNHGGIWACCPVKRKTVTFKNLAEAEVEILSERGFSFGEMFACEPLRRWFYPELPENVLRAQAECEAGEICYEIGFNPHLYENFYSHAAIQGMTAELRGVASCLKTGRVEEVPYEWVRTCIARRDYEPADVADFYYREAAELRKTDPSLAGKHSGQIVADFLAREGFEPISQRQIERLVSIYRNLSEKNYELWGKGILNTSQAEAVSKLKPAEQERFHEAASGFEKGLTKEQFDLLLQRYRPA